MRASPLQSICAVPGLEICRRPWLRRTTGRFVFGACAPSPVSTGSAVMHRLTNLILFRLFSAVLLQFFLLRLAIAVSL